MQIFSLGTWMPFEETFRRTNQEELKRILCNPQEHDTNQPILCPDEMYVGIQYQTNVRLHVIGVDIYATI